MSSATQIDDGESALVVTLGTLALSSSPWSLRGGSSGKRGPARSAYPLGVATDDGAWQVVGQNSRHHPPIAARHQEVVPLTNRKVRVIIRTVRLSSTGRPPSSIPTFERYRRLVDAPRGNRGDYITPSCAGDHLVLHVIAVELNASHLRASRTPL
jgi:hypothetical protein